MFGEKTIVCLNEDGEILTDEEKLMIVMIVKPSSSIEDSSSFTYFVFRREIVDFIESGWIEI